MSSLKPFNMTFTEDDLRSVKSPQVSRQERSTSPLRTTTPPRPASPSKVFVFPRISTPTKTSLTQSLYPGRPSTFERRIQVNNVLAEEEREYRIRKREKQQKDDENYLKEQLKLLEVVLAFLFTHLNSVNLIF